MRELVKRLKEYEILKQVSEEQKKLISELERSLDFEKQKNVLCEREVEVQKMILDLKEKEIEFYKRMIKELQELNERAIKLAEVSNKSQSQQKSNWQWFGVFGVVMMLIGALIVK